MFNGFKNLTLKFAGINAGYYFSQIVFFGYIGSILRSFGYGETFIGTMQSVGAFAALALNLIFGYVSDKYGHPKRIVTICYSMYSLMQVVLFYLGGNEAFVMAFAVAGIGCVRSIMGIYESWQLKLNEQYGLNINYGRVRGIGSLAYSIIGLVAGWLIGILGYEACIFITLTSWLMVMISCLGIAEPELVHSRASDEEQVSFKEALKFLLKNKGYVTLLVCMLLGGVTNMTVAGNFSMIVSDSPGGSADLAGIGFFVMAFTEFWVFFFSTNIAKKIGFNRMFVIGLVFYSVKSALMVVAPNVYWIIGIQCLQTVSFAFVGPSSVAMLDGIVSAKYKAEGMQLLYMVQSLSSVIFNSAIGYIYEQFGYRIMLGVFAPFSAIGAIILSIYFAKSKTKIKA